MATKIKASVIGLLGLGFLYVYLIFYLEVSLELIKSNSASIAPTVRLKYLLLMNDSTKFLEALSIILAWAQAEVGIGMLVANLPACRPILERALARFTSFTGSKNKSSQPPTSTGGKKNYLELDERLSRKNMEGAKRNTLETKVYGRDLEQVSSESLVDDGSQKGIVGKQSMGAIRVHTDFGIQVEDNKAGRMV